MTTRVALRLESVTGNPPSKHFLIILRLISLLRLSAPLFLFDAIASAGAIFPPDKELL